MYSESLESKESDAPLHQPATLPHGQASRESSFDGTSNARSTDDANPSHNVHHIARWRKRFDLAGEILEDLDMNTKKKWGEYSYYPSLQQERKCLERFHAYCTSRRSMAVIVVREIQQKLDNLRRKLSEYPSLFCRMNIRRSLTILVEFILAFDALARQGRPGFLSRLRGQDRKKKRAYADDLLSFLRCTNRELDHLLYTQRWFYDGEAQKHGLGTP